MTRRRSRLRRTAALAVLTLALGAVAGLPPAAEPARGEIVNDGGDTGSGGSAVTVRGAKTDIEDFSQLEITVNQTKALVNQAVVVTWKGGTPTPRDRLLGTDYLQFMQCWGDPHAPDDPDGLRFRETCQFGSLLPPPDMPQANSGDLVAINANSRMLGAGGIPGYPDREEGETVPNGAKVVPFWPVTCQPRSATCAQPPTPDGSPQNPFPKIKDPRTGIEREAFPEETLASYFTQSLTNEFPYGLTAGDGTGRISFEVQNATLAPHLGCGAAYVDTAGHSQPSRSCYLVIVPRGHFHPYKKDPPLEDVSASGAVHGSPLLPALWRNRIVVPMDFEPVADPCPLDRATRLTTGTELAAEAARLWRAGLCTAPGGPSVSYSPVGDFEAGQQLLVPSPDAPGLVYTAEPVPTTELDPPLVHAPVALSSVVIALNIDVKLAADNLVPVDPETAKLRGLGLRDLKLTPRLVAKLLTQSYRRDVPGVGGPAQNPNSIKQDPEFLDLNPVFRAWDPPLSVTLKGLMVPNGSSVAARALWTWVLSDPAAAAWLKGTPDNGQPGKPGMVVNPNYVDLLKGEVPDYFPKVDPACVEEMFENEAYRLCTLDYRPYMSGLGKAAEQTLRADMGGRQNPLDTLNIPSTGIPEFPRTPRDAPGSRFAMAVTDSASAARYGLFTAQLCRATYQDRKYKESDCRSASSNAVLAAANTASPSPVMGAPVIDPAKAWATPGAYPLSVLTYAAADLTDPADARHDYATLLRHAAGEGQQPGFSRGQLPPGYVPLPQAMRARTMIAADQLERGAPGSSASPPAAPPPNNSAQPPPPAAPGGNPPPAAPALPGTVPSGGAVPSPGGTAPSPQPSAKRAGRATPGSPLGNLRYLIVGLLVLGLIGGIAGPVLRRLATRHSQMDSAE